MTMSSLFLWGLLHAAAAAEPTASGREVLSLQEAVRVALTQQPQLRQANAGTEAASARADEARAPLLPQLNATGIYSRSTANFVARPGQLPSSINPNASPPSGRSYNYFQFGFTG